MFKSIIAYRYNSVETDFSQIHEQIKNNDYLFKPLNQFSTSTYGFNRFYDDVYIIEADNRILLNATFSDKTVSPKTVNRLLEERIEKIKTEQGIDSVSDDSIAIYRQEIENELLKYTDPVNKSVLLLIDKNTHHIYVDTSSSSLAEDALHLLRKMIGKLVCRFLSAKFADDTLSEIIQSSHSDSLGCLRIADCPRVATINHEDGVKISLSGLYKKSDLFTNLFLYRKIKSIDFELFNKKYINLPTIANFHLYVGRGGILIIKNFSFDEPDDELSDDVDAFSYRYTSKMLLVGRYMNMIIDSLGEFLKIDYDMPISTADNHSKQLGQFINTINDSVDKIVNDWKNNTKQETINE